jgi:hypothetical protein
MQNVNTANLTHTDNLDSNYMSHKCKNYKLVFSSFMIKLNKKTTISFFFLIATINQKLL